MPISQQTEHHGGASRPRPRAHTSLGPFPFLRRGTESPSLASTPAAPLETMPIESLIEALTPPAVPSLAHVRSLVSALPNQTPAPSPSTLLPILANLCSPDSPPALQAGGFDILTSYCSCGISLQSTVRASYFELVRTSNTWSSDVWEPRLKALSALFPSAEEMLGSDSALLALVSAWLDKAVEELLDSGTSSPIEKQEKERSVDSLHKSLLDWLGKIEGSGRLSDEDVATMFDFYHALVEKALEHASDPAMVAESVPPTPHPESSSSNVSTPVRHHRKQASSVSLLNGITTSLPQHRLRVPVHHIILIYLRFLESKVLHLPPQYLNKLLPLLFRILAYNMSPLPVISVSGERRKSVSDRQEIEHQVMKMISGLLAGPYSTACLILLKRHLGPFDVCNDDLATVTSSLGAHRALRLQIRQVLEDRMAMLYLSRQASGTANPVGVPTQVSGDQYVFERADRAWKKDTNAAWDAQKVSYLLMKAIDNWLEWKPKTSDTVACIAGRERIFEEIAALLKDVLQELDDRGDEENELEVQDDTPDAIGETLKELVKVVKTMTNGDGTPVTISLDNALSAPTPLLRILADILGHDHTSERLRAALPSILLSIPEHLADSDSEKIPTIMSELQQLTPISSDWLENWALLLKTDALYSPIRPATRAAILKQLGSVFSLVNDMPSYRRPLSEMAFDFWMRLVEQDNEGGDGSTMWKLIGDEIMLRSYEDETSELFTPHEEDAPELVLNIERGLRAMTDVAGTCDCFDDDINAAVRSGDVSSPLSPLIPTTPSNTLSYAGSPVLSRTQTESPIVIAKDKEKESLLSLSIFSFGGNSSRQQVPVIQEAAFLKDESTNASAFFAEPSPSILYPCRGAVAVSALVDIFTQLSFTSSSMTDRQVRLAIYIFERLLTLLRTAKCTKARLVVLQALLRLRADRDHRVYMKSTPADHNPQVMTLAALIDRASGASSTNMGSEDAKQDDASIEEPRRPKPRPNLVEREGRFTVRGKGGRAPDRTMSRSRSRVAGRARFAPSTPASLRPKTPLWTAPDVAPFSVERAEKASQLLLTYDTSKSEGSVVLPVSSYLEVLSSILATERDWDILSYVLVHIPIQLANKHFWCGPRAKEAITRFLSEVLKGVTEGTIGKLIPPEDWPGNIKPRDAQSLAYHSLTVLVSYISIFDMKLRLAIVEAFQAGLSASTTTVRYCLHALSICAFEMQPAMIRSLPRILEKLSQIMTNPSMAVHILTFLSIVASIPTLYANFNEDHYRMVFAVALQYLQHHNRPETLAEISFALSQHLRILSYYVVYTWFLTLSLTERPLHIKFISRQLLLANQGAKEVDAPTEVCYDWLSRYTYGSGDPKPATSLFGDIITNPNDLTGVSKISSVAEKSWVVGNSIVTVKRLVKPGWLEVVTRRASGTTKFLCRAENVPLVGLGDVNPDMVTVPASLMVDKDANAESIPALLSPPPPITSPQDPEHVEHQSQHAHVDLENVRPDELTGYVWSGSAPSQRRKRVELDPAYFPLQLSSFPDNKNFSHDIKIIRDTRSLASLIRTLDRTPVIDTHKVGILYAAPGQTNEVDILKNTHGSPAYTRFLAGLGRLISLRGQLDVYTGGLNPDEDGEYAYAWWDDIGQILYHTATLMPNHPHDQLGTFKKRHIGNDYVRIVWNDSGKAYKFDTVSTEFQFVNIVIEPHSLGAIAAYSNNFHENEYFKITVQCADGMVQFSPIGDYKIVSALSLPPLVRQLSLISDWYASIFQHTSRDTEKTEFVTNWRARLDAIKRFADNVPGPTATATPEGGIMVQEAYRDFTSSY